MERLNETIDVSEKWAIENKMKINVKKSKIMILCSKSKFQEWEIS